MAFSQPRRELEPRWVSEWVAQQFPKAEVRFRCPLGGIPRETQADYGLMKGLRVYRPWRPEVDALVIQPGAVQLIEAKIQKYMDGLSKLPVYKSLVSVTPELQHVRDLPVKMTLLIPAEITWVKQAAAGLDVNVVVWAPDYIRRVWDERDKYWTREAIELRDARKKKLQEAGIK